MPQPIVVLVVEDELLVQMDIVQQLEHHGFEVLAANNAAEAMDILTANATIHILFTDIDMPGSMDGLKLAKAVRNRWPPIKIIVTSGHLRLVAGAMPAGSRFLGKPYLPDNVAAAVREMMAA